jgi:hypothetical protein
VGVVRAGFSCGVILLVAAASCGGVSTVEPDAETGGNSDQGQSGGAPRGGATSTGGKGRAFATGGKGGTVPTGGSGGSSTAGKGGTSAGCFLERLGDGLRCSGGEGYAQGPGVERIAGVGSFEICALECFARSDCTAVIDYPTFVTPRTCGVYTTPCDHPSTGVWYEEDAAKDYRKVCAAGGCQLEYVFEYVGDWMRCEDPESKRPVLGAQSLADCEVECLADPYCTAVSDHFWLDSVPGCYLFTGDCSGNAALPPGDPGQVHRKVCGEGGEGGRGEAGEGGNSGGPRP